MTAIQIHRRGVDDRAARGDGRDCAASFCFFLQRGGYSGVLLGYCRGTTGVPPQSLRFGRTIIDPLLRIGKVPRATVGSVTVLQHGCSVSRYYKSMLGLGQDQMADYSTHPSWSQPRWPNLGANDRLFGPHVSLTAPIDFQLHGASRVGRSTAGNCGLRGGRAGASGASATFLSMRVCRRSAACHARRLTPLAIAASGRAGTSDALRCCRIRISSAGDDDSAARCTAQRK